MRKPSGHAVALIMILMRAGPALAAQGPGVGDGTAEPITQAAAAAMALLPPVAVAVFALAKLLLRGEG